MLGEKTSGNQEKAQGFDTLTKDLECSILDPIVATFCGSLNGALLFGSWAQAIGAF
jgi:hypothetical protein